MEKVHQTIEYLFNLIIREELAKEPLFLLSGVFILFSFLACCTYLFREKKNRRLSSLDTNEAQNENFDFTSERYDELKLNISDELRKQFRSFFVRHATKFMEEEFNDFLKMRSPIFYQDQDTHKIVLTCFPNDQENKTIEELYLFWKFGFRHRKLPLIFLIYFASIKQENFTNILNDILDYQNTNVSQKNLIWLYFQTILSKKIDLTIFPIDELEAVYQTDSLFLSQIISSHRYEWNINTFKEQIDSFQILREIEYCPPMKELLLFFMSKSTKMLRNYIVLNFTHFLGEIAEEIISKRVFEYGNYKKLLKITHPTKELKILISSIFQNNQVQANIRLSKVDHEQMIKYLAKQRYPKLHIFYYLKAIDAPLGAIQYYGMNESQLGAMMKQSASLPLGIRWILFQYLVHTKEWEKALELFQRLGVHSKKTSAKILQLRCLFYNAEDHQKEEYLNEIKKISIENPNNLSFINEYAIHLIETGKILEAQKTLKKMSKKSSNNPITLYNQALLFENLYSRAIKQKWRKFHQVKIL